MPLISTLSLLFIAYTAGGLMAAHECDTQGKFYSNGWYVCTKQEK